MHDSMCIVTLFVVFCLVPGFAVSAQNAWFVDASVAGPGSGSPSDPFAFIQDGINAASNGDSVLVRPGVYAEAISFLGKDIVVRSTQGPDVTVIDGATVRTFLVSFENGEPISATLDGFTVRGAQAFIFTSGTAFRCINASATLVDCVFESNWNVLGQPHVVGAGSVSFLRCVFRGNLGIGVLVDGGGSGAAASFSDCLFDGNGMGLRVLFSSVCVERCYCVSNTSFGIGVSDPAAAVFKNCIIVGNGFSSASASPGGGVSIDMGLANLSTVAVTCFLHCTITGNSIGLGYNWSGSIACTTPFVDVANSIVWGNPQGDAVPMIVLPPSLTPLITWAGSNTTDPLSQGIDADPLFVDPANGDYRLRIDSPCRDAGDPNVATLPATDFEGDPRVWGAAPDIGADEFAFDCLLGTVGTALGQPAPVPVVAVNGSSDVFVTAGVGQPLTLTVGVPPALAAGADFALWLAAGDPATAAPLALPWGDLCLTPSFLAASSVPQLAPGVVATPAPWNYTLTAGIPAPARFTLQGLILQSPGPTNAVAVTNAVTVDVR